MKKFLARQLGRMGGLALTMWVVVTITFFLMRSVPGGPFDSEKPVPPAIKRNMEARYKLNDPWLKQYTDQWWNYLHFDLGPSYKLEDYTVNEIISQGFPVSASLGIMSLTLALMFGMFAGVVSAVRRNSLYDVSFMLLATMGVAVPNFVLSGLAIVVFVFWLKLLPAAGWGTISSLILPSLCLAAPFAAYIARLTRTGMLEVLSLDYIRTAYAKGLQPRAVILRHALRGAILPVVSFLGPATAGILTGSLVIERIFNIQGMGSHFIESATQKDWPLATGMVVVYTFLLCLMNMLVDISYSLIDPRVTAGK